MAKGELLGKLAKAELKYAMRVAMKGNLPGAAAIVQQAEKHAKQSERRANK
jgi:hypothetical protein